MYFSVIEGGFDQSPPNPRGYGPGSVVQFSSGCQLAMVKHHQIRNKIYKYKIATVKGEERHIHSCTNLSYRQQTIYHTHK